MIKCVLIDGYWCAFDTDKQEILYKHKDKAVVMEQMLFNFFCK